MSKTIDINVRRVENGWVVRTSPPADVVHWTGLYAYASANKLTPDPAPQEYVVSDDQDLAGAIAAALVSERLRMAEEPTAGEIEARKRALQQAYNAAQQNAVASMKSQFNNPFAGQAYQAGIATLPGAAYGVGTAQQYTATPNPVQASKQECLAQQDPQNPPGFSEFIRRCSKRLLRK